LVSVSCAGQVAQGPDAGQRIATLEAKLLEAEKRAIVGEIESSRLRRRVHELEEELATARGHGHRTAPPETPSQTPQPQLTSAPESQQTTARQPSTSLPPEASDSLPIRESTIEEEDLEEPMEASPSFNPEATLEAASDSAAADAVVAAEPPDEQTFAVYDTAYVLFHEQSYRQAETAFQEFVKRYPNSELTDNAQFWIGECRYALGDFTGALQAFSATVANFPEGNKVPDALLKAGKCLEALNRSDQARQTYLEVQRRFPDTAIALAAKERLAEIDSR
jgi:tol-pal system protein YbgF